MKDSFKILEISHWEGRGETTPLGLKICQAHTYNNKKISPPTIWGVCVGEGLLSSKKFPTSLSWGNIEQKLYYLVMVKWIVDRYRVSEKSDLTLFLSFSQVLEHVQRNF